MYGKIWGWQFSFLKHQRVQILLKFYVQWNKQFSKTSRKRIGMYTGSSNNVVREYNVTFVYFCFPWIYIWYLFRQSGTSDLKTLPPGSWTKHPGYRGGKKIYPSYEAFVISNISRWYVLALAKRYVLARKCHQKLLMFWQHSTKKRTDWS